MRDAFMDEMPHLKLVGKPAPDSDAGEYSEARAQADDLLMIAAAQGDRAAFATLVARYESHVRSYCGAILHHETQAWDAAQDVFLRLWATRLRYRPNGKFRQYLYTIARNIARNLCRSKRRRQALAHLLGFDDDSQAPANTRAPASPHSLHEQDENARHLRLALSQLDEKLRDALVLRYFNDLSYDEIAAVIGRTPSTARSRIFYGLRRLAELLPKESIQ
jgi:RNA polymerase sigma-70 factor (ECF subfamily)